MDNLNLDFDKEQKKINIDEVINDTGLNIKPDNTMMGVELLVNNKNTVKADLNVVNDVTGGISSNGNTPIVKKEEYDFFNDNELIIINF